MTRSLGGAELATSIRNDASVAAAALAEIGVRPKLAVVQATDDESTAWYVRSIASAAKRTGILCDIVDLGAAASTEQIRSTLVELGHDPDVHGIILQTPLPDETDLDALREAINPAKDVDGANPVSLGRLVARLPAFAPATAQAVIALLDHHGISPHGRTAAVVGRSTVVGSPVAHLLVQRNATVTVCHRHTTDLAAGTRDADILVVAVGIPGLITADHVADGAVVIDVGTTATADGRLLGDVDAAAVDGRAGALTPVPGGVGPVTTALLLNHTVDAAATQYAQTRSDSLLSGFRSSV
ncbi:bifunctional 5,10-methylenetetrahydrofolate dehydrogenase/5,10-methenyltetrahydrofolate cyclohydrolase [Rhodococcus opacus]|uniref:bifunctional 5,10-methylenetetrahydrofolate dehydrogenase/5,10-methenyltetrahydrofolate cyclohydrolase n=1 Tax=Rhodococcus TaxID=1827 RepID=UPI0006BB52D3|nr:bifunctional 5,10-methylenetetrahydrofolate dehydrogenase/5,10-methenyltetrahydrofolate cyclohydrolase [Rhodococcus opacus]NHU42099.1 bifunctional 5,10-methylenetetrahydrofolate dehydrogenase/5,10-methenyltetrahydrofolate cyclohydrolase [Rhodococcus sp. A14]MDJ0412942.1 bifunctional 5,10-methylenetetrahydrofolate dehydrogenase/5,10-methenyltetrahydrofolate cyclohydrolase [Rhodococcus opacus]UNN00213.1 bifunctional 5,10-methylenetetrahydrofolate dehydrogenase/5,10-methenyltetrahydrofolate cycl